MCHMSFYLFFERYRLFFLLLFWVSFTIFFLSSSTTPGPNGLEYFLFLNSYNSIQCKIHKDPFTETQIEKKKMNVNKLFTVHLSEIFPERSNGRKWFGPRRFCCTEDKDWCSHYRSSFASFILNTSNISSEDVQSSKNRSPFFFFFFHQQLASFKNSPTSLCTSVFFAISCEKVRNYETTWVFTAFEHFFL